MFLSSGMSHSKSSMYARSFLFALAHPVSRWWETLEVVGIKAFTSVTNLRVGVEHRCSLLGVAGVEGEHGGGEVVGVVIRVCGVSVGVDVGDDAPGTQCTSGTRYLEGHRRASSRAISSSGYPWTCHYRGRVRTAVASWSVSSEWCWGARLGGAGEVVLRRARGRRDV